jgi:hypothetical protein
MPNHCTKGKIFHNLPIEAQNSITLGFNSTLDLSNHGTNQYAQKHLFGKPEWNNLIEKYQSTTHCKTISKKVKTELESIEKKSRV